MLTLYSLLFTHSPFYLDTVTYLVGHNDGNSQPNAHTRRRFEVETKGLSPRRADDTTQQGFNKDPKVYPLDDA